MRTIGTSKHQLYARRIFFQTPGNMSNKSLRSVISLIVILDISIIIIAFINFIIVYLLSVSIMYSIMRNMW